MNDQSKKRAPDEGAQEGNKLDGFSVPLSLQYQQSDTNAEQPLQAGAVLTSPTTSDGAIPTAAAMHQMRAAASVPFPNALRNAKRWLLWKEGKIPHYTNGNRRGIGIALDSEQDVAQLVTFSEACDASWQGDYLGVAIALGPDGDTGCHFQGIDLDNVSVNLLSDLANQLPGYVERSPSGEGCHALGYGRPFKTLGSKPGIGIEAYAAGRYFTFTGETIRSQDELVCLADYVEQVLAPRHASGNASTVAVSVPFVPVDAETITDLRSALKMIPCGAGTYTTWTAMGHALRELGGVGRELWLTWSEQFDGFKMAEASKKWDQLGGERTGYQAVFAEAQRQGWLNPNSNAARGKRDSAAPAAAPGTLQLRAANTVEMKAIKWLWRGWIARGYINLVAGETASAKSTVLADIAARVTTGRPWPDDPDNAYRPPARVLWLGSEDSMSELTGPRLAACQANGANVLEIVGVTRDGKQDTFSMQDDIAAVRQTLEAGKLNGLPFELLVIDPVTSYLQGKQLKRTDMNDNGQLRTILEPWSRLAQETGLAVVCVTHLAKDSTRTLLHRVLGAGAFTQIARSLCAVVKLPDGEYSRALMQVKNNLPGGPKGAYRFSTAAVTVAYDSENGQAIDATHPVWESIDPTISPEGLAGGARGPVSAKGAEFATWIANYFRYPAVDELPVAVVKEAASKAGMATESWWNDNSSKYLEKTNRSGTWVCRPV